MDRRMSVAWTHLLLRVVSSNKRSLDLMGCPLLLMILRGGAAVLSVTSGMEVTTYITDPHNQQKFSKTGKAMLYRLRPCNACRVFSKSVCFEALSYRLETYAIRKKTPIGSLQHPYH